VVDLDAERLAAARRLGADDTIRLERGEAGQLQGTLGARVFPLVVDASGSPAAVETALRRVAPGGRLLLLGSPPRHATIAWVPRMTQRWEIAVLGSFSFGSEFPEALEALRRGGVGLPADMLRGYSLEQHAAALAIAAAGGRCWGASALYD